MFSAFNGKRIAAWWSDACRRLAAVAFFDCRLGQDNDQYFRGEWGHDDSETGGGPWNGVKLRRRRPERCNNAGGSGGDTGGDDDYDDMGDDDYDEGGDYDDERRLSRRAGRQWRGLRP